MLKKLLLISVVLLISHGCGKSPSEDEKTAGTQTKTTPQATEVPDHGADLVLTNGKVYTYSWPDPDGEGNPAASAPFRGDTWSNDAQAVVIKDGKIIFVGSNSGVDQFTTDKTITIDLEGATVLPGFIDAHAHVEGLGRNKSMADLSKAKNEKEAVDIIINHATVVPKGQWVLARGWDEGLWANSYPDMNLLSEKVPDHPVFANSLHGFAAWGNSKAFEAANITAETKAPVGGEIRKDKNGNPSGILINNATDLLSNAIPNPGIDQLKEWIKLGSYDMAKAGYVGFHLAGVDDRLMQALESLKRDKQLNLRVYAMISASSQRLVDRKLKEGPDKDNNSMLVTRSVKGYYDGALGSRGAKLLEDYSDKPGHRGIGGQDYAFNSDIIHELIRAGFQIGIHAIGDAGNREVLDLFEEAIKQSASAKGLRHRVEHAQIIHPADFKRFQSLGLVASMQPPHAAEDKAWAEDRVGPDRIKGGYAWRTLRRLNVPLAFGSDLTGSDHNLFYGLHSATTRRSKDLLPKDGWQMQEALNMEEAIRGYTRWPAYAAFMEKETGTLEKGRWADITVIDIDPHNIKKPEELFNGKVVMTIANGVVLYTSKNRRTLGLGPPPWR